MEIKYLNEDGERISKNCDLEFGKDTEPYTNRFNLLSGHLGLLQNGFTVFSLEDSNVLSALENIVSSQIEQRLAHYQRLPSDFQLKYYHRYLENPDSHFKISTWALDYKVFGETFFKIKNQIEGLLKSELSIKKINHLGIEGEYVGFRVIRPQKNDHNPFHRDSWIPFWRDTINVWLPICGFEDSNSLQLIPKSHTWHDNSILKTKSGVEIDKKKYHVPAAIGTINSFSIETPLLKKGDGLVFSPFLIHGNGVNHLEDVTRVSLEFRFRKTN